MVEVRIEQAAMDRLLRSPSGGVARDLLRRGRNVESEAKRLCPVNSGRLRSSITADLRLDGGLPTMRVGTNVAYARYVHDGTGIYGPRRTPIRPVRASILRFEVRGEIVWARQTRGSPPRPFLAQALGAARR